MDNILFALDKERISAVLANIGDGVISADINGKIDYMNRCAEILTGWNIEEALEKPLEEVFELINIKTRELAESPFARAIKSDKQVGLSNYTALISKGRSEKLISANASPIKSVEGQIMGVVIVFRDITSYKEFEDELKIERNNLRVNFENAPIGMAIINEEYRVLDANNSFLDTFGVRISDVIGKYYGEAINCKNSISKFCGSEYDCLSCKLRESIFLVLQTSSPIKSVKVESTLVHGDEELQKHLKINFVPIVNYSKINVMISIEDITEHKLMEESLERSRDFYLTLFDDFPALIWRSNTNNESNYFNKRWLEFTGRKLENEIGTGWIKGIHPEDTELFVSRLRESYKTRMPCEMQYRLKRYDGQYRWIVDRSNPYYDMDGNFAGFIGACNDITEEKNADIALKKYQVLAEKARDTILFMDMDGKIIEANDSALKIYGYSREEILTKTVYDLRGGYSLLIRQQIETAKKKGIFFEATHYRKDGTAFPVEVDVQSTVIDNKEVLLSIIRDITGRKKVETALKESEEKYRSLFNSANDAIFLIELVENETGISTRIIEANNTTCRRLGYSRRELQEINPEDIFLGKNKNEMIDQYCGIIDSGHGTFESVHISKDGRKVPVELSSHYFNMDGRKYILTIARDISERKQVEIEMRRAIESAHSAYKAKSDFLANMSHEIRTPLNGVIGMIELTMLTELNPEQRDNLLTAKTCADSLLRIINDILDFSKIEAGKFTLENIDFDLKVLIEKIQKVHYYKAAEKGLELSCQLPPDLPVHMKGDPARLQQVLNNLIGNAVKFTEKGSVEIIISIVEYEEKAVKLQFSVVDTGIGISLEEKAKLFKSFSQVDSSHSRKYGGTGLGLVISKQLIEMMGGRIWAESVKGKGSVFNFQLVFEISNKNNGVCGGSGYYKFEKPLSTLNILLVEDDNINQIVVGRMLKELGYSYSIVNNGVEAISLLKDKYFDLCLMDIQMPGMDGIQTAQIIRSLEKSTGKHLPIIALTAHALMGDREKFISLGMDDYLAKPFLINDLQNVVSSMLSKYESKSSADILKKLLADQNIKVDSEMNIDSFSENDRSVIAEIKENISGLMELSRLGDITTIEKLAHEIKQLSVMINAEKVKVLAFRVELAARRGDFAEAVELAVELDSVFKKYTNCIYNLKNNL